MKILKKVTLITIGRIKNDPFEWENTKTYVEEANGDWTSCQNLFDMKYINSKQFFCARES